MDKKKELKKGVDPHKIMDKLFTKLKMAKHNGEEKPSGTGKRLKEIESTSSEARKPLITWENNRLTPGNIMEFSNQLERLLEHVQTLKNVAFYTYQYPNTLSEKLEKEALELRNLFVDVRSAAIDIQRLQKQRYLVKKEKCLATKKLDKLREEEIRELESIICAYAKPLHTKWEVIKNSQKADVVENFMNEVTGKHRAIEILQELVRRKLAKINKKTSGAPFAVKKNVSSNTMNNKAPNQDKTNSNWSVTPFSDLDKFSQTIDRVMRGTTDRNILRINRRKRQKELREERRRQTANASTTATETIAENSGGLDLQLVPIDSFPTEEVEEVGGEKGPVATAANLPARTAPIINIEFTSDEDSVSLSSSDLTIENFVQTATVEAQSDLQNEMRNVLQALFGEIRQFPQLGNLPGRNRYNNSGNDLRTSRTTGP